MFLCMITDAHWGKNMSSEFTKHSNSNYDWKSSTFVDATSNRRSFKKKVFTSFGPKTWGPVNVCLHINRITKRHCKSQRKLFSLPTNVLSQKVKLSVSLVFWHSKVRWVKAHCIQNMYLQKMLLGRDYNSSLIQKQCIAKNFCKQCFKHSALISRLAKYSET